VLREAALTRLGQAAPGEAVGLAARLVALDPFDERHQELLIRAYALAGDTEGARRQLTACEQLFRDELGIKPAPSVYGAVGARWPGPLNPPLSRPEIEALIERGHALIVAGGTVDDAHALLTRAVHAAEALGERDLQADALLELGTTLVGVAQGRSEEGAVALHQAITVAEQIGDATVATAAHRSLAVVDLFRGAYGRAEAQLDLATALAGDDPVERTRLRTLQATCLLDQGHHEASRVIFERAIALAESDGDRQYLPLLLAHAGRGYLLREEFDRAREILERSLAVTRERAWSGIAAAPEALLGHVELHTGKVGDAQARLEHAYALACAVHDPCWEGWSAHGLGLVAAARGDETRAVEWLEEACTRSARVPDAHLWGHAWALDGLSMVLVQVASPAAASSVRQLQTLAERTGMREFVARAHLYRHAMGQSDALDAAHSAALAVDNPALRRRFDDPMTAVLNLASTSKRRVKQHNGSSSATEG
jgi:tetratricopeptide (TPR) repeat protein